MYGLHSHSSIAALTPRHMFWINCKRLTYIISLYRRGQVALDRGPRLIHTGISGFPLNYEPSRRQFYSQREQTCWESEHWIKSYLSKLSSQVHPGIPIHTSLKTQHVNHTAIEVANSMVTRVVCTWARETDTVRYLFSCLSQCASGHYW